MTTEQGEIAVAQNVKPLIRFIAPKYPHSVFSWIKQPPLGLVMVATIAKMLGFYEVEIIDENNCTKYVDKNGFVDHAKLQKDSPAAIVGISGAFTCAAGRLYEIAKFYHAQRVLVIAGGKHIENCPKEALENNVDIVVRGEGEESIRLVLSAIYEGKSLNNIPGISFKDIDGAIKHNSIKRSKSRGFDPELEKLSCPDFSLLKYVGKLKVIPICRVRLCDEKCKFCSVRGMPRWYSPEKFCEHIDKLVAQGYKSFFIVDDNSAKDWPGYIKAFLMIAEKYGRKLRFMVQARQDIGENEELQKAMYKAGVRWIAVGCESPDAEELREMGKGYGPENMVRNIRKLRERFNVYAMLIFGYPVKGRKITAEDIRRRMKLFVDFIKKTGVEAVQIFHPGVAVGSVFRKEQERLGTILKALPWSFYTGDFLTFLPAKDINAEVLKKMQRIPIKIMGRFYRPISAITDGLDLIELLIKDHKNWRLEAKKYWIKSAVKLMGWWHVARKWGKGNREKEFFERIQEYLQQKNPSY